jgi:N,N-dimethylformamidase
VEYPHDGAVFSSSSITWDGSLSYNKYDNTVSKVTANVLKKFSSDVALAGTKP